MNESRPEDDRGNHDADDHRQVDAGQDALGEFQDALPENDVSSPENDESLSGNDVSSPENDEVLLEDDGSLLEDDESLSGQAAVASDGTDSFADSLRDAEPIRDTVPGRPSWDGPPRGIRRADGFGLEVLDAMAGRASPLGLDWGPLVEAICQAARRGLGDAAALIAAPSNDDEAWAAKFRDWLGSSPAVDPESIFLTSSADMAVEKAVELARRRNPNQNYRIITAMGSDHGRTGVCRIASGRPELHDGYGPMMAGFSHVPVGEIDALRAAVDEQTCAILFSPLDFADGMRPLSGDYLHAVRETCDTLDLALIFDESRIGFASAGTPLVFSAVTDIHADGVILGGGLFGGLPGGMLIASEKLCGNYTAAMVGLPLLAAAAATTLDQIREHRLLDDFAETSQRLQMSIAETVEGFEFVRDLHCLGTTVGIEMDIESSELVATAAKRGLRIEPAGEAAVQMQLPLVLTESDHALLLTRIRESMEAIERATADVSV